MLEPTAIIRLWAERCLASTPTREATRLPLPSFEADAISFLLLEHPSDGVPGAFGFVV